MHPSQLAEIGSWISVNAGKMIFQAPDHPLMSATSYWTNSKIRLQRWITALKMFEQDFGSQNEQHDPWPAFEIVAQEIIMSELLTRVWAATVMTYESFHATDQLHGLIHSVHISHIEAKNRTLRVLLKGQADNEQTVERLNALRRRMERWTDLFLGQLPDEEQAIVFAFDRHRVLDFHRERSESVPGEDASRQQVLLASLATDMLRNQNQYSANPGLNREIVASILSCFPNDRFDAHALPRSAQTIWMDQAQQETQTLIDQLIEFEDASVGG